MTNESTINQQAQAIDISQAATPGFLRRLMAMFYDSILLFGIVLLASGLALMLNGGKPVQPNNPVYSLYMLLVIFWFYAWFWTHGGQTLGLRAWRSKVIRDDGQPLTWKDALLRFVFAIVSLLPAGLGFFWSLIDRDNLAWHDRWSKTRLVLLAKAKKS